MDKCRLDVQWDDGTVLRQRQSSGHIDRNRVLLRTRHRGGNGLRRREGTGGNPFNGALDEVHIYDRALSAFELNYIFGIK